MLVINASCLLLTEEEEEEDESKEDDFWTVRTYSDATLSFGGLAIFLCFILGSSFLGVEALGTYYFYFCSINFAYSLRSLRFLAFLVSFIAGFSYSSLDDDESEELISGGVTLFFLSILALLD